MSDLKTIYISEWTTLKSYQIRNQYDIEQLSIEDLNIVDTLETQGKISIRQLSDGIEIKTNSYVGLIKLSNFQIVIKPKINKIHLPRMISFTYGLENIDYFDLITNVEPSSSLITDLLALLFLKETEKIMLKGLSQRYIEREENISSCRGKIVFNSLAKKSSHGLTLPCRYQELSIDIPENRLILASLIELSKFVNTLSLKQKISNLREDLSRIVKYEPLTKSLFKKVNQEKDRLTSHYSLIIELAGMILTGSDFSVKSGNNNFISFLLDMNLLFEKFLYRYLEESTNSEVSIKYQKPLTNKYISSNGEEHRLIPDYLLYKSNELFAIADAKYKNYNSKSISSSDLYQLTVYGIVNHYNIKKIYLLYPSDEEVIQKEYCLQNNKINTIKIIMKGVPLTWMLNNLGEEYINLL